MAEEEMYIALSEEEIQKSKTLPLSISVSPDFFAKRFRVFKLLEVHGKD
jgi:hypothetical protein